MTAVEYVAAIETKLAKFELEIKKEIYVKGTNKYFGIRYLKETGKFKARQRSASISFTGPIDKILVQKDKAVLAKWQQIDNPVLNEPRKYTKKLRKILG
jgi:hypothetical protein